MKQQASSQVSSEREQRVSVRTSSERVLQEAREDTMDGLDRTTNQQVDPRTGQPENCGQG